jgi:hypothetical protein
VIQEPPLQGVLERGFMHICTQFLSSALGGGGHLYHRRKGPSYSSSRELGGPRAVLDASEKRKLSCLCWGIELRFFDRRNFSLAREMYMCRGICAVYANILWCRYLSRNELGLFKKLYSRLSMVGMCAGRFKS